jgi:hypothetical protein
VGSNPQVTRNIKSVLAHIMIALLSDDPSGHEAHFGEVGLNLGFSEGCFGCCTQARFRCRLVMLAEVVLGEQSEGRASGRRELQDTVSVLNVTNGPRPVKGGWGSRPRLFLVTNDWYAIACGSVHREGKTRPGAR